MVRPVRFRDRSEWLRMLANLYPGHPESVHVPDVDAYLAGTESEELVPSAVLVWERPGGGLGGFLELSIRNYAEGCSGPTPYIESWYVDSDARRKGIGRALINAAEEWARERGYSEIASDTHIENAASRDAHQALGFEEVERTVHFRKSLR